MIVEWAMLPVQKIKERVLELPQENWPDMIKELKLDSRKGVQNIVASLERELKMIAREKARLKKLSESEALLREAGYRYVGGIDEVGRGPLAGPVVAACVILPEDCVLPHLNDSKKLSADRRQVLEEKIKKEAVAWSIGLVNHKEIDRINIFQATKLAMLKAVRVLKIKPDYLLLDAMNIDINIPQKSIIHGDSQCAAIAAASIIAKTYRDRIMGIMDDFYPEYGFKDNMGYGTARHLEALKLYGPSSVHRRSFLRNIC